MHDTLSLLYRRIVSDQKTLTRLLSQPTLSAQAEEAARLGRDMGLTVDPEVAREFLARSAGRELTDQELSGVAGGKGEDRPHEYIDTGPGQDGGGPPSPPSPDDPFFLVGQDGDGSDDDVPGGGQGGQGGDGGEGGQGGQDGGDGIPPGPDGSPGGGGGGPIGGGGGEGPIGGGDPDLPGPGFFLEPGADPPSPQGGDEAVLLSGTTGDDTLTGGSGDDVLLGNAGDDQLTGGAGDDTFLFGAADGHDTITDFQAGDSIILTQQEPGPLDFSVAHQDGNTVITYGQTTITVENATLSEEEIRNMQP